MTWGGNYYQSFNAGAFGNLAGNNHLQQATQLGMSTAASVYGSFGSQFGSQFGAGNAFSSSFGMNPFGLSGNTGVGNLGTLGMFAGMTTNQITNNQFMSPTSQLAWIDAKWGHLFNAGYNMNRGKIDPMLWKAQASAIDRYMQGIVARQQQQQQQPQGFFQKIMAWVQKNPLLLAIGVPVITSLFKGEKLDFSKIFQKLLGGLTGGGSSEEEKK